MSCTVNKLDPELEAYDKVEETLPSSPHQPKVFSSYLELPGPLAAEVNRKVKELELAENKEETKLHIVPSWAWAVK